MIEVAVERWQQIVDLGYQPRVLSAPLRFNATSAQEKTEWLGINLDPIFGAYVSRDAILDKAKYKYEGVALIDDRPDIPGIDEAMRPHVVIHYQHNAHTDTDLRLKNMLHPRLEEVLAIATERYGRKMARLALE